MTSVKDKYLYNSDNDNRISDHNENNKVLTDEACPVSDSGMCSTQNAAESEEHLTETVTNDVTSLATNVTDAVISDSEVLAETSVAVALTAVSTESDGVLQTVTEATSSLPSTATVDSSCAVCEVSSIRSHISSDSQLTQPYPVEVSWFSLSQISCDLWSVIYSL